MFKRKKSISVLPYLGLAIVALAIQPFLPEAIDYVTIRYLPEGTAAPISYKVEKDQIQRLGSSITFNDKEREIITLCNHYEEK